MNWNALPVVVVALGLVAAACGGGNGGTGTSLECPSRGTPPPPPDLASLSLEDVYERMADSMTCPGYALHVTSRQEWESIDPQEGKSTLAGGGDTWLDVPGRRAREERQWVHKAQTEGDDGSSGGEFREVVISLGDALYGRQPGSDHVWSADARLCPGSQNPVVSFLLHCGPSGSLEIRFDQDAKYEDRNMPALAIEGESRGSDETITFTGSTYLDEATLLPVAAAGGGVSNDAPRYSFTARYKYEFVPLESLPADLFRPAAIGYVEPDPEEELRGADIGTQAYWLGVEFPGANDLPALSLTSARLFPDRPYPSYRALIDYRLAHDKFGLSVVGLQLYTRAEWEAFLAQSRGGNFWDWPCVQNTELDLGDRWAVVFGGYELSRFTSGLCHEQPPDKWGAYVYIEDTVILVGTSGRWEDVHQYESPGSWKVSEELVPSPYNSREGMEVIIRGLVPRPPDE